MKLLPAGIEEKDYYITDSLADVEDWRVPVWVGNSIVDKANDFKKAKVGYVMVKIKGEPNFIPIAREDEHELGKEMLFEMAEKWNIDPNDYFPIFTQGTCAYIYDKKEIPDLLIALTRWHHFGGKDLIVTYTGNEEPRWTISTRDFIQGKGTPIKTESEILPIGKRFIDHLKAISYCLEGIQNPNSLSFIMSAHVLDKRLNRAVEGLLSELTRHDVIIFEALFNKKNGLFHGGIDFEEARDNWIDKLKTALTNAQYKVVEEILFSHNSLKNRIHMKIREEMISEKTGRISSIFGNVSMANDAMGRISPGLTKEESEPKFGF